MIVEDQDVIGPNSFIMPASSFEYIRFLPTISAEYANPKGLSLPTPCKLLIITLTAVQPLLFLCFQSKQ
jgi:hypothetical protein